MLAVPNLFFFSLLVDIALVFVKVLTLFDEASSAVLVLWCVFNSSSIFDHDCIMQYLPTEDQFELGNMERHVGLHVVSKEAGGIRFVVGNPLMDIAE